MRIDDNTDLRARIDVRLLWREPPSTPEKGMHRHQAELKVQEMARQLERGLEEMLVAILAIRVDD